MVQPFWKMKTIAEMTTAEWESLCDGCGKCCLIKLVDEDTDQRFDTDIHCKLFDNSTCRCSDYANRKKRVPDCVVLRPDNIAALEWIPKTCAYRRLSEGKDLPDWHPLVTGNPLSTQEAGYSVRGMTVCETSLPQSQYENHLAEWPGEGEGEDEDETPG